MKENIINKIKNGVKVVVRTLTCSKNQNIKRDTVTLTLPCPLKRPQKDMYVIAHECIGLQRKRNLDEKICCEYKQSCFDSGIYFASREDAMAWLEAMRNSRR